VLRRIAGGSAAHAGRLADCALPLEAGPERCVLATKSFAAKLAVLLRVAYTAPGRDDTGAALVRRAVEEIERLLGDGRRPAIRGIAEHLQSGHLDFRRRRDNNTGPMSELVELLGRSPKIVALREKVRALLSGEAATRRLPPLLITGETGTGKSLLARLIHEASSRAAAPFVELNGAAIPDNLLESELFGYERGAFTDARQSKPGLFQVAHRGTLFLDEVGLLPLALQAKLLKVLEDGTVRRLGATRSEPVDVCVISATNEDLQAAVRARRFREDLYHRLAVMTLALPPLRELGADIGVLAEHALARACAKYSLPLKTLSPEAQDALQTYRWPGNVRELNSVIERAVLMCPASVIPAAVLALEASPEGPPREPPPPGGSERERLAEALAQTGWNVSRTAAMLGITRNTVRARIAKYGLHAAPAGRQPDSSSAEASHMGAFGSGETPLDEATVASGREPGGCGGGLVPPAGVPTRTVEVVDRPAGALGPQAWLHPGAAPTPQGLIDATRGPSVAVLPFHVHGESDPQSYFGDSIVEDIIGSLAALRELLVISRTSTLRYRGAGADVRVAGRDLGVSYVLSGSLRRAGNRLRVSAELAETTRGGVVWASHFDGISEDLFALQDQLATRVASTIAPHVREAELRRALRKRPENMEAYDCMLRGLAQLYRLNLSDFNEAHTWLEKAIALDPAYAAPYALLAIWHTVRFGQGWSPDVPADQAEVLRLATAAVERDSFDAMALAMCGHAKSILRYEFPEAISLFDRAITASPSSAIAWTRSSPTYSYVGDAREAIRRAEHGLRLSPLDLHVFYAHGILGLSLYVAGEYGEAIRWGRQAMEENPRYTANLRILAASLAAAGHADEARGVSRTLLALDPSFEVRRFVEGYAIRDPERRDRLARHLGLAGLPG
jgi:DNA-binding NtrC family response regulator/TolB-like protein